MRETSRESQPAAASPPFPSPSSTPLGETVARGFSWLSLSIIVGKIFGALAQLALGRWITDVQFRDFAIVASIASLIRVFQDGGVPQVMIQRGRAEYDRLLGPVFWLSVSFGVFGGFVLAVSSPIIAWAYDSPILLNALLVVALSLAISAPSTVMRARLRIDLRFQTIAVIAVFWFLLRHLSAVGFAAIGLGVIGLVLPLLIVAVYETVACYCATHVKPWRKSPGFREWSSLLSASFWVVATAMCRGLARTGDYLVLGLLAARETTGKYFFAYTITTQVVELLATNLQHVLFPALSRLADEPERQSRAIVRTIRMLVFVAAPASLALAVAIGPLVTILDEIVWNHKWSSAIPLMQIFAVTAPVRVFSDVLTASLSSRGQFRNSALLTLAEGVWLMLAAACAAEFAGSNLAGIAFIVAIAQAVFSISSSIFLLRQFDIGPLQFIQAFLPSWLTSLAAAGVAASLLHLFAGDSPQWLQLVIAVAAFVAAFVAMARVLLRANIEELVGVVPKAFAGALRRAFLLPNQA